MCPWYALDVPSMALLCMLYYVLYACILCRQVFLVPYACCVHIVAQMGALYMLSMAYITHVCYLYLHLCQKHAYVAIWLMPIYSMKPYATPCIPSIAHMPRCEHDLYSIDPISVCLMCLCMNYETCSAQHMPIDLAGRFIHSSLWLDCLKSSFVSISDHLLYRNDLGYNLVRVSSDILAILIMYLDDLCGAAAVTMQDWLG
jgi:hypothetical protein